MTAHGELGYFVTVRAADESKLNRLTSQVLREYMNSTLCKDFQHESNGRFKKFHRKTNHTTDQELFNKVNFFDSVMKPGDPDYSARDPAFIKRAKIVRGNLDPVCKNYVLRIANTL